MTKNTNSNGKRLPIVLAVLLLVGWSADAADFHVSVSGSDSNSGTEASPFLTIAKAMEVSSPGDTCVLREGVYRETIVPLVDDLTIRAYEGENVIISGCDQVTGGWGDAAHNANIKTRSTPTRVLQVFIGEDRMNLARFPDFPANQDMTAYQQWAKTDVSVLEPAYDGGTGSVIFHTSASLPNDGADTWVGGYFSQRHDDNPFTAVSGEIIASSGNTITCNELSYGWWNSSHSRREGTGYIINCLRALDSEMEWFSADDGTFYFYPPSGIDLSVTPVDIRTRLWGADLSNRTDITIERLHFYASSILMSDSVGCLVSKCEVEYPAPWGSHRYGTRAERDLGHEYGGVIDGSSGVFVSGQNNVVDKCFIHKSWGSGIRLEGTNNTVSGSLIEDVGWITRRMHGIQGMGQDNNIIGNTVRNCAQAGIDGGNNAIVKKLGRGLTVQNNFVEDTAQAMMDCGAFYQNSQGVANVADLELSYNVFNRCGMSGNISVIYLDNSTTGASIHHNLCIGGNADHGIKNYGDDVDIYNNTVRGVGHDMIHGGNRMLRATNPVGFVARNNLGDKGIQLPFTTGDVADNITNADWSRFVDADGGDYRPKGGYAAVVDSGSIQSPITDGYVGAAPDIGCFEYGQPVWNAGSWVNAQITAREGTLVSPDPLDPIELIAGTTGALADFSIVGGAMGLIPVTLHDVPADAEPVVALYFNGQWSQLSGVEGTELGGHDYAYVTTANLDGTVNYSYLIQRSSIQLSSEWRIQVDSANDAPYFNDDPVIGSFAIQGAAYSGVIRATDEDAVDTLTYTKDAGPDWLLVDTDGSLSGTPLADNLGVNRFTVTVEDAAGESDTATLEITVLATSALVYYDTFANGNLAVNADVGGGISNSGAGNGAWTESGGAMVWNRSATGGARANGYTNSSFDLSEGFTLEVDFTIGSYTTDGNQQFSFGIVEEYAADVAQRNSFTTAAVNDAGIGFEILNGGAPVLRLVEAGETASTFTTLSALSEFSNGSYSLSLTITPDGLGGVDWSYSLDGGTVITGNIASYTFAPNYAFVAHARDNETSKSIQKVRLIELPDTDFYYDVWIAGHSLTNDDALPSADIENGGVGDGYTNLMEFALGMDPTVWDAGSRESHTTLDNEGTEYFEYMHYRRTDYVALGLSYDILDSETLLDFGDSINAQDDISVGPAVDGYEPVFNRYLLDVSARFFQLSVQQNATQ